MKLLIAIFKFASSLYKSIIEGEVDAEIREKSKENQDAFQAAETEIVAKEGDDLPRLGKSWDEFNRLYPKGSADLSSVNPESKGK